MKIQKSILYMALCLGLTTTAVTTFTGCSSTKYSRSTGQYVDDKTLAEHVRLGLDNAPGDKYDNVQVTAYRGTVQLSGFVNNQHDKKQATNIARNSGAHKVSNQINIKPGQYPNNNNSSSNQNH